jgi:hypothetical protein
MQEVELLSQSPSVRPRRRVTILVSASVLLLLISGIAWLVNTGPPEPMPDVVWVPKPQLIQAGTMTIPTAEPELHRSPGGPIFGRQLRLGWGLEDNEHGPTQITAMEIEGVWPFETFGDYVATYSASGDTTVSEGVTWLRFEKQE